MGTYIEYSFKPPRTISEIDYNSYKQMLLTDPSSNILKEPKSNNSFSIIATVFIVSLIGMAIGAILKHWTFVMFLFIAIVIFKSGVLGSEASRSCANDERAYYHSNLKSMILESKDYHDFINKYKSKYNYI